MSGLVYGLQNRPRRFESATHLRGKKDPQPKGWGFFLFAIEKIAYLLDLIVIEPL